MTKKSSAILDDIRGLFYAVAVLTVLALIAKLLNDRRGHRAAGGEEANAWAPPVPSSGTSPIMAPVSRFPGGFNMEADPTVASQSLSGESPTGSSVSGLQMEVAPLVSSQDAPLAPEEPPAEAGQPDDLKIIEGIGPKTETVLHEAGITTFRQLAGTPVVRLEEITRAAGLNLARPQTWPEQARLAAEGRMQDLQNLMDQIEGGRKVEDDE